MTRKELMVMCRVYKGQPRNPYMSPESADKGKIWYYEKAWVDNMLSQQHDILNGMLDRYRYDNLSKFSNLDGVPIGLKALMYSKFCDIMGSGRVDEFKKWYSDIYLKYKP